MAVRCDICGRKSPDRSERCECGYHFISKEVDTAIDVALGARNVAHTKIAQGVAIMLAAPAALVLIGMLGSPMVSLLAAVVGIPVMIGALAATVRGVRRTAIASRQLRLAETKRALPAARISRD